MSFFYYVVFLAFPIPAFRNKEGMHRGQVMDIDKTKVLLCLVAQGHLLVLVELGDPVSLCHWPLVHALADMVDQVLKAVECMTML